MKVYNGKLLALTVLVGGGLIAYFVYEFYSQGRWTTLLLIAWFAYLFVQGLRASLTEEGYEKDRENARRGGGPLPEVVWPPGRLHALSPFVRHSAGPRTVLCAGLLLGRRGRHLRRAHLRHCAGHGPAPGRKKGPGPGGARGGGIRGQSRIAV